MPGRAADYIAYLVFAAVMKITAALPFGVSRAIGRLLGRLIRVLDFHHRRIALDNLRKAFKGEKTESEIKDICRGVFDSMGQMIVEFPRIKDMDSAFLERMVRFEGVDIYRRAKSEGKGVIFITGHYGNWEMAGVCHAMKMGVDLHGVVKQIKNKYINEYIVASRNKAGLRLIGHRRTVFNIMKVLKGHGEIVFVIDQNAMWHEGVFVDFFGRKACTLYGPAAIAMKLDVPVVAAFCMRYPDGTHTITYTDLVKPRVTGDFYGDISHNTQVFTGIIEREIRKAPEQWFWVHRRWKTVPGEGREWDKKHGRWQRETEIGGPVPGQGRDDSGGG